VVRIRDVPAGESATFTDEPFEPRYAVKDGDLLVGMDGIFHTAIWSGGDAALNQRVTRLRPRGGRSTMWLLLSVMPKIKHLEATITGTTVAHLSARDLKAMPVVVPAPDIQQRADGLLSPIGDAVVRHRHEQRRLAAARDLLLPRLISGDLTVAAAERELETAA
jgi:type I restriction enzyme S subunit